MKKIIDKVIQLGTANDIKILYELKNRIGKGISVVYVYKLVDIEIEYPNKKGKVLYIGEACSKSNPTGDRFRQHISNSKNSGKDSNVNYTINTYYWKGIKIQLEIFEVKDSDRLSIESNLIDTHIKVYGAKPIAQGSTGKKISDMNDFNEKEYSKYL